MSSKNLISELPYCPPFLFVDELLEVTENGIVGTFTFNANLEFYKGHFKKNPVTPGVILTECCAQIGVVCLGIYLLGKEDKVPADQVAPDEGRALINMSKAVKREAPSKSCRTIGRLSPIIEQKIQMGLSSSSMEFLLPVFPGEKVTVTSQKVYFRFNKLKCKVKMQNSIGDLVCKGEIAGMIKME